MQSGLNTWMIGLVLMNWLYTDYPENMEYTQQYLIKAMCGQRLRITSYEVMKRSSDFAVLTWYSWAIPPMELSKISVHLIPLKQNKPQHPPLLTKSRAKLHVVIAQGNQRSKPDQNLTPHVARDREP